MVHSKRSVDSIVRCTKKIRGTRKLYMVESENSKFQVSSKRIGASRRTITSVVALARACTVNLCPFPEGQRNVPTTNLVFWKYF